VELTNITAQKLNVRTSNGAILATSLLFNEAQLRTSNGAIDVVFTETANTLTVQWQTSNGHLNINKTRHNLPRNFTLIAGTTGETMHLNARTSNGRINLTYPNIAVINNDRPVLSN
jgi:DUF4097 and DUF4098 domain-containing protein YvlB